MKIRLLIADDHELIRCGLRTLLADTHVDVIAETDTAETALDLAERLTPDVLLLDVRIPLNDGKVAECAGLDILEELERRAPNTRVVVLSLYDNPTYLARAAVMGARDFVLRSVTRAELLDVLQRAVADEPNPRSIEFRRIHALLRKRHALRDDELPLTQRELQVLRHVALGLSNKEVGRSLGISVETVKEHVQNILRKLPVSDRTQAAVWAVRQGLV